MSIGTIFLKQLVVVAPMTLSVPSIGMDALTQGHTWWIKPKLLAFLLGATKWGPVHLPPPVKTVNTLQYWLKQGTEGLWLITRDMLDPRVIRPTISPFDKQPYLASVKTGHQGKEINN